MKKKIKVILLEDIAGVGQAGQIINTSEGYARNSLFPDGKAALATPSVEKKQAQAEQAKTTELQAKAEALNQTELTLTARVKDGDEIYGSITAKDIAKELKSQAKLDLKPKQVKTKPIVKLGSQSVEIELSPEVSAEIQVTINAEEE